jgi:hypothetical protein
MIPARRASSSCLGSRAFALSFAGLFSVPFSTSVLPALVLVLAPAVVRAQQPGQPPPLPMAVDLRKVAVGSWAEYNMSIGELPPMKSRMALVAKSDSTNTVEMIMEGGMLAMSGSKLIMQSVVDADQNKEKPVKKVVMQIGDNDPMDMPIESQQQSQFHKPNPKSFIKDETVKVAAGTFKTKHYRDKMPNGAAFDFWVSPEVPPYGIVKVEAEQKGGTAPAQGPVKFELTARGKDAKMMVTKAAKPFDQAAMVGQLMGGAKGAGGLRPLNLPPPSGQGAAPAKN